MSETRIPEALALLKREGWGKGRFKDDSGARCIGGALLYVHGVGPHNSAHSPGFLTDHQAVRGVLVSQYGTRSVACWNDDPATTFADVEFVLEKAILERGGAL